MARPRTPTAILEARGAFDKNPKRGRERAKEAVNPDPIGDAPAGLRNTREERRLDCWHELVSSAAPGVLTAADRFVVEMAARLLAKIRSKAGGSASDYSNLHKALASIGMTPADRSKVAPPGGGDDGGSPWDKLEGFDA